MEATEMFIDYVTLMLVNMSGGFILLGAFLLNGMPEGDARKWVAAFAVAGLIAFVTGLRMTFTWPLPGPYNMLFGESSVLLGAIFLGIALALGMNSALSPLAALIAVASLTAVLLGCRVMNLGLTARPAATAIGFILSGIAGLLTASAFLWSAARTPRTLGAVALFIAAALWLFVGYSGYWAHAKLQSAWEPPTMHQPPQADE
jgi:putative membrane protein